MNLLHIDTAITGSNSVTRQVTAAIVEAARKNKKCVAHQLFPWELESAAMEYWLVIARRLHGSLVVEAVTYRRDKPHVYQVRALVRGGRDEPYEPVAMVMSDPQKRDYLLAKCLRELTALRREYATLSELALVFSAIDRVVRRKRA